MSLKSYWHAQPKSRSPREFAKHWYIRKWVDIHGTTIPACVVVDGKYAQGELPACECKRIAEGAGLPMSRVTEYRVGQYGSSCFECETIRATTLALEQHKSST